MSQAHTCRPRSRGLSLIEMLAGLAIGATVLAAAVPSYQALIGSNAIQAAANQMLGHLAYARSEAITRNRRVVLCPTRDRNSCHNGMHWEGGFLVFEDENANRQRDPGEPILAQFSHADQRISMTSTTRRRTLTFQPSGQSPGSNVTLTLCDPDNPSSARAIIVSNTGRPRVSRRAADGSQLQCSS